jgi:3-keto-5-aminohexanoate cleavage enzyme
MTNEQFMWDYRSPYEWMERVKKSEFPPMIVEVAITGGFHGKEANPNLPETAEEQADAVYAAYRAGASIVHVHARGVGNHAQTTSTPEDYSRVNRMIRERCPDIVINNTTGGGPTLSTEERMAGLFADPKPDLASLNPGPFMLRYTQRERPEPLMHARKAREVDIAMPITYGEVDKMADTMRMKGIKPEIELFHPGHYWVINELIKNKKIDPPYVIQFVMGFPTSIYPTPQNVLRLIDELPLQSIFLIPGVGSFQLPMSAMAMVMGGHVRVGLEDNLFYRRGELAKSNAQLVERAVRMGRDLNREIATPAQTREMLGLPQVR